MLTTRWLMAGLCGCALVAASALAADQPNPNPTSPQGQRDVTIEADRVDVEVTRETEPTQQVGQQQSQQNRQQAEQLKQRAEQRAQEAKDLAERAKQAADEARQLSEQAERMQGSQTAATDSTTTVERREQRSYRAGTQPVKSSDLEDMDIRNQQGDDLGNVNDLVLDPQSGQIRYAIVAFGGWFGIGDEKVAIPWNALQLQASADDAGEHQLLLNRTKAQLKNAPKVEDDSWFNNDTHRQRVDTFYGSPTRTSETPETTVTPRGSDTLRTPGTSGSPGTIGTPGRTDAPGAATPGTNSDTRSATDTTGGTR